MSFLPATLRFDAPTGRRLARDVVGPIVAVAIVLAPAGIAFARQAEDLNLPTDPSRVAVSDRADRPNPTLTPPPAAAKRPAKAVSPVAAARAATRVPVLTNAPAWEDQRLVPAAKRVGDLAIVLFGLKPAEIGGYASGGHMHNSDHYTGHAVDLMMLPYGPAMTARGDQLAAYVIKHADELDVKYVIWQGQIWYPKGGWHTYRPYASEASRHFDHVHVSVN